jgi:hypothetical protein
LVSGEAAATLIVWYTWHHQTPLSASVVRLLLLGAAPLVDDLATALGMRGGPMRNHLHDIKYMKYKMK